MAFQRAIITISANSEWEVVINQRQPRLTECSPYGDWFCEIIGGTECIFLQGGWGKISAAGSTQYAVDRWQPDLIVNLGTCGGFAGHVEKGEILLVTGTTVYDILEQMSDPQTALDHYSTDLDLSWLVPPEPIPVRRSRLISADRDILAVEIPALIKNYHAIAADWESSSIAWVAHRNQIPCLILRGVSDVVGSDGGEAYGNHPVFVAGTILVMSRLLDSLPGWLACCDDGLQ